MSTTNKIFVDTSVFVEFIKGRRTGLMMNLLTMADVMLVINETVVGEYLYYYLAVNGNAAPRTLQQSGKIPAILQDRDVFKIFSKVDIISAAPNLQKMVAAMMLKYNLLPNDSIILATCKLNGISKLASYDKDFKEPCKAEGIELLTDDL